MVRTRNQGASPGGFQSLDSPFFKRTRKLPKSKKQLEEESAAKAAGVSVETIRQESVVYYHSPNTISPSPPPPTEVSTLISRSEPESPPPPITMSVIEPEPQPKQPASRMSESVQEPPPTPISQPVAHTKDIPRTISAVTERMNKPKMQIKKPKMVLSSFPSYEEDMESDDELMEELQDRSKFSASVGRKSARSYLDAEQRKEIQARMAGKSYIASTPIKNSAHKKKPTEGPSSRKSMALQTFKSPLTVPYVHFFIPGQEPIILTNHRILDILHAVADWATRDPSSLPDAEEVVARLEAPKSSGLAAIMPANHTVEGIVDTDSPMGNPSDLVVTTYAQPDTASEGENSDDDIMNNSDEDEPMAESNSEVAISPLPETSKASEKSTYHGWGLLSAVKSIVSTPIKLFGGSQHTAAAATTNNQKLDLNFQSMKTNRINNRVATPKSATARRTLQSLKAKTSQSERKPLSKEAPWVPMHQRGAAEVSLAMEKAKKEFRKQQQKKKAAQRQEAEENDNLHHIDNHQGTFKAPEYDSDSTEEDEPESPLVRKIAQPKKTVTWSDQTPMPGRFTSFEEEGELSKYDNINVNPNPFTQARANVTSISTSPGLWVLQNQWAEEGKSVEECAALEAEFLRKEEANKTAWRNQAAANRAEARERQMALERMERNEREKNEQARQAAAAGKTINGISKQNQDSYSVNETHYSNETNPDYSSFEATSNTSIWDGTNPDTSSVNETAPDNQPSVDQFSARKTKYMNMVADNYFSGRDLSKSPYIDQKINPFAEGVWSQEDRAKYQSPSKVQQEKEESTRNIEEQSQIQEEIKAPSNNQPLGELQNLPTVLEHPSVSAAKATATKYSPKKPSTLRHVEMASPTHSDRMSSQEKENKVVADLFSRDHLSSQASSLLGRFMEPAGTSLPIVQDPDMVQHFLDEATRATYDMLNTPEAEAVKEMADSLPYTAFTAFTAEYTPLFT